MDTTELAQFGRKTASCELKTDLELLLECLKFQMDNPDSQKETLVAVRSICQKNIYCQQTLCTLDLFEDVLAVFSYEESSVNLKRMSVFILLVLVSNNKTGQTFARESGCIDMLLRLFSNMLTCYIGLSIEITSQEFQLWTSVCSTLCSCVNNPQNEENQRLCSSAFLQAAKCLQHSVQPEITRPICSMICLTVANNSFAQDYFASVGGLDTLAEVLLQLVKDLHTKPSNVRLAVVVTKTLDACISENLKAVHCLSKHSIISSLITLLSYEGLETEDMFSIVLTVGHCTEDCEPNQYELLKCNGLPLMIQALAGSKEDELHKAATFVLQNCRHITENLSVNIPEKTASVDQCSTSNQNKRDKCLADYREKAKVIARKIDYLQQEYDKASPACDTPGVVKLQVPVSSTSYQNTVNNEEPNRAENLSSISWMVVPTADKDTIQCPYFTKSIVDDPFADSTVETSQISTQHLDRVSARHGDVTLEASTDLPCRHQNLMSASSRNELSSRDAVAQTAPNHVTNHFHDGFLQSEEKQTARGGSVRHVRVNNAKCSTSTENNIDPLSLCAEMIDKEISKSLGGPIPLADWRCSGCISSGLVMNSRNCNKILRECSHLCDHHRIILQAEEQYRREIKESLHKTQRSTAYNNMPLTPIGRTKKTNSHCIQITPIRKVINQGLEMGHDNGSPGKRQGILSSEHHSSAHPTQNPGTPDQRKVQKRTRKDFTQKEIADLLDGVKKFGRHWNAILWSYPFQKGRTNVDLAKKYKKLQFQN